MSNFTIANILNLKQNADNERLAEQAAQMAFILEQQAAMLAALQQSQLQHQIQVSNENIDMNQNVEKKKRGRKKGSKNRPKEVILREKLKRSKSENDSAQVPLVAPNLPQEETCENEFLCGWCKKLFSSAMGRMRHSMHCNWNPERINKLKAKRKKSREDSVIEKANRVDGRRVKCRLKSVDVPLKTELFQSTPLYNESGTLIGQKMVPLKRSMSEPSGSSLLVERSVPNDVKTEVKLERIEQEDPSQVSELLPNVNVKTEPSYE